MLILSFLVLCFLVFLLRLARSVHRDPLRYEALASMMPAAASAQGTAWSLTQTQRGFFLALQLRRLGWASLPAMNSTPHDAQFLALGFMPRSIRFTRP